MPGFCPLFSSSKANSTVFYDKNNCIVVDMGASYKKFLLALSRTGIELSDIKAIAVTHDHSDHIAGLKTFLRNNNIPLIASQKTLDSLTDKDVIPAETDKIIADESEIVIGDTVISQFPTRHDSPGSCGYILSFDGNTYAGICTDTGVLTKEAVSALLKCKSIIIESNHDLTMLKNGPYTPSLKMRILSDQGHLSNNSCAQVLPQLLENGTTRFVLGHLSETNNTPLLAKSASVSMLKSAGATENKDYVLTVAKPAGNGVILF